jgi:hypothetical protein
MRRLVYGLMWLLMIGWTAAVLLDISQGLMANEQLMQALDGNVVPEQAGQVFQGFWGQAAQARAVVWGIPMTVFALIAVITHPGRG